MDEHLMTLDRVSTRSQRWALRALAFIGWRFRFKDLPGPRGVVVVYPHTSNWDFMVGILAKWAMGLPFHFVAKASLFEGATGATVGRFLRYVGGVPIERSTATGAISRFAEKMKAADHYWLVITPEGTRTYRPHWRSGFYHIALAADVPVACAYFDFKRKEIGMVDYLTMTGDVAHDLAALRQVFAGHEGCHAAHAAPIVFKEE